MRLPAVRMASQFPITAAASQRERVTYLPRFEAPNVRSRSMAKGNNSQKNDKKNKKPKKDVKPKEVKPLERK
jgi:hypothetical protein